MSTQIFTEDELIAQTTCVLTGHAELSRLPLLLSGHVAWTCVRCGAIPKSIVFVDRNHSTAHPRSEWCEDAWAYLRYMGKELGIKNEVGQ